MNNTELILLLGIGLAVAALGLVWPTSSPRPVWVPMVCGVAAASLGVVVILTIAFR